MNSGFRQPKQELVDELKTIVGENGWKSGTEVPCRYYDDPRGRFEGNGCLILLPSSTEQVSQIVKSCNLAKIGIIPYGGGTGVVAGQLSIDSKEAIIISVERMNKVREISIDDSVMVAEAGCILENIHNIALESNLTFPLSMASKGSCSIGGNLATNAGGIQVLRYGNARDLCLGIEAVLPDGSIYSELNPLIKNNTGYDLRHLLIGSEGTLGIITAATLSLYPIDDEVVTVFCALDSPSSALKLYKHIRKSLGGNISALELMSDLGLDLVTKNFPLLNKPFTERHDWYLLLEVGGHEGIRTRTEAVLEDSFENELIVDAIIAQSQSQRNNLWDLRENTPESNRLSGAFCNSDTSVPISKVDDFIEETFTKILAFDPNLRVNAYGHIGDGNIHYNVLPPDGLTKKDFITSNPEIIEAVRMAINETTMHFGGSISAEHGIGRLKAGDLEVYANPTKHKILKSIKLALDPNNIMNPGAIIDLGAA
jgi:FAD/FMN-containing dehydrogenase